MSESDPLIEPYPIEDEFCSGLACIEDQDGATRFVLYTNGVRYEDGNRTIRVVCKKIVVPFVAIAPAVEMIVAYLARKAMRTIGAKLHLVKDD